MAESTKSIPEPILDEFVGYIKNHLKTECYNVYGDRWRINVWTSTQKPDSFMRIFNITESYFVKFDGGVIKDETIKPTFKPETSNIFKSGK